MLKISAVLAMGIWGLCAANPAQAADTVECHSINYQYTECRAAGLTRPQLVNQTSSRPCIVNRSWGFNPESGYLWVAEGCSGVFADVGGYHYGRGGKYDANGRSYDDHGHDVGALIGGAVVAALVAGMIDSGHKDHAYTSSNRSPDSYNGCHGSGCQVDNPDDARRSEQFNRKGEYVGCHGAGCLVDDPDRDN